jgi:hypothetical protein
VSSVAWQAHEAENLTDIYDPIVYTLLEPQHIATLRVAMAIWPFFFKQIAFLPLRKHAYDPPLPVTWIVLLLSFHFMELFPHTLYSYPRSLLPLIFR